MTTPLGLAMMTPTRDPSALPELSGATLDPDTQLGMLDGIPLHKHAVALVVGSTQTNPDGQDPFPFARPSRWTRTEADLRSALTWPGGSVGPCAGTGSSDPFFFNRAAVRRRARR